MKLVRREEDNLNTLVYLVFRTWRQLISWRGFLLLLYCNDESNKLLMHDGVYLFHMVAISHYV